MGLTGDFAGLHALIEELDHAESALPAELSAKLAAASIPLTHDSFLTGTDPYDEEWQEASRAWLARRSATAEYGFRTTLVDTGRLMLSIYEVHGDHGFSLISNVPYARIHQEGNEIGGWLRGKGIHMPQRPFLPLEERGLGTKWTTEYERVTIETIDSFFGVAP